MIVGSLPTALVVERRWSVDLDASGTGNSGAGNATRTVGIAAGVTLAVLDGLKGLLPILAARQLGVSDIWLAAVGLAAVTGNNWPIWRSARGGRGLATSVGVIIAFAPPLLLWPMAWSIVGWRIGGGVTGFMGWAFLPAYVWLIGAETPALVLSLGLATMMIVRRAQGNAGFMAASALRRIVFDEDPRATVLPERVLSSLRGRQLWVPALLVIGLPAYLWATGTRSSEISFGPEIVGLLAAAAATELGAKFMFGELFRESVNRSGVKLSRMAAFRAALVGTGVARLIPVGGAITPVAMAWSVGDETEGTVGAAIRATALNYGSLAFAAGAGLMWVTVRYPPASNSVASMSIGVGLAIFGAAVIGFSGRLRRMSRIVPSRWRQRVQDALVDHDLTLKTWLLISSRVLLEAATLGLTLIAFDVVMRPSQVIAAFGVSQIVGGIPGPPGGLGVTEAGLLGILVFFGIPAGVAAGPVLAFRLISYWLPALGGVAAGGSSYLRRHALKTA